jgi:hypothetical protein
MIPQYCRLSAYQMFQTKTLGQASDEMVRNFTYGSRGYDWLIRFDRLLLEAIEDGRNHPKSYGRLEPADVSALQNMAAQLMSERHLSKLAELPSESPAARRDAIANMNLCVMLAEALTAVNRLPDETKGRAMNEIARVTESGALNSGLMMDLASEFGAN